MTSDAKPVKLWNYEYLKEKNYSKCILLKNEIKKNFSNLIAFVCFSESFQAQIDPVNEENYIRKDGVTVAACGVRESRCNSNQ